MCACVDDYADVPLKATTSTFHGKKSTASARNQSQNLQAACGGLDNALPYTNLCCVLKSNSRQMNRSVMPVLYFVIACFQFYVGLLFPVCVVLIVIIVWLVLMILAYDRFCYFGFSGFCLPHSVCPPVYDLYAVLHSDYRAHFLYLVPLLCLSLYTWICAPGLMTDSSTSWNTLINKNPGCKCSPSFTHFFYFDLIVLRPDNYKSDTIWTKWEKKQTIHFV